MATKLNWEYVDHSGEYVAKIGDYRIRAVRDEDARNPFEDEDGHWPIVVRSSDGLTRYPKNNEADDPFYFFSDAQLMHWRFHITKLFGFNRPADLIECYAHTIDDGDEVMHLREALVEALDDAKDADRFDIIVGLYKMIDVMALSASANGYTQGCWAEVLVVAPPKLVKEFGCIDLKVEALQASVDLYKAWAYGDVYGYVIEKREPAHDNEDEDAEIEWIEIEDGSCWGFYGAEFDESGLEEAAMSCLPDGVFMKELVHA